ncbi:MAG TPA: bifunctional aldolase/short-chain dehydrogenase [Steroidobacteraceae bacterium]|nr:bifunctional aldolase/short-chain dehydrogenase [Steroidobacteraceae bacterium]
MKNRWNDLEANGHEGYLAQRVYTSRLLGQEPALVMHGGGNTSVKGDVTNIFGRREEILFVKGSGWDLKTIEAAGFTPCRMSHLLQLAELPELSDSQMAAELKKSQIDVNAPAASVEAILHAVLPARFVDHTHADAILALTNTPGGEERVRRVFGERLVYIPYVMPGFKLARLCAELFPKHATGRTIGMLLLSHGLFTFGDTARSAYDRMIGLVSEAEEELIRHGARWRRSNEAAAAPSSPHPGVEVSDSSAARVSLAAFRKLISDCAAAPMIMRVHDDGQVREFVQHPQLETISQQGPATPDHVIRTKRLPLLGRDVGAYAEAYRQYFAKYGNPSLTMLDPAPRVVLDRDWGLCAIGRTARDADVVEDIYRNTMDIICAATVLGGWRALSPKDIFEVEYWELEQAKLRKGGTAPAFAGEVVLVTGAASGIGKACVAAFLARGAAVVGLDISPSVTSLHCRSDYLGIECDLRSESSVRGCLERAVRHFGGLDMLILNAGIFPQSSPVAALPTDIWRNVMSINVDANLVLMRECHPLLKLAPRGGRVVLIGSKNVPAPGPGAAAYSASKAALQQLARVAALEWGQDRIRVNTLHPNAVFDTGIWTPEVLAARADSYRMTVERYRTNNVLGVEVSSRDVAELAVELCDSKYSKTTGAQIPVDGGNVRVI